MFAIIQIDCSVFIEYYHKKTEVNFMMLTIKAARVNSNLTIIQAAKLLEINKDTLSRLERNSTDISISLAQKMAKLYHISMDDLYFGKLEEFDSSVNVIN